MIISTLQAPKCTAASTARGVVYLIKDIFLA